MEPMERLALSRGNARQFTKLLLSLLSHIGKMVGCLGIAPSSRRLRAGTSLSKFATLLAIRKDRDAKAELNRRSQVCEALTGTGVRVAKKNPNGTESGIRPGWPCASHLGKVDGHESNALSISVWKTDVCLSTPMPEEMESRAGIAPASAALQAAA